MGFFKTIPPRDSLVDGALKFLEDALTLGKLSQNYLVSPIRDDEEVADPGDELMKIIRLWPRFSPISDQQKSSNYRQEHVVV